MNWLKKIKLRHKLGILIAILDTLLMLYLLTYEQNTGWMIITLFTQWPGNFVSQFLTDMQIRIFEGPYWMSLFGILGYYFNGYILGLLIEKIISYFKKKN